MSLIATTCVLCDETVMADATDQAPMCEDCLARCYWCGRHCEDQCPVALEVAAEQADLERRRAAAPPSRCYGRWHWRRWRLTSWIFSRLYVLGVTATGGNSGSHCPKLGTLRDDCPGHPGWGWVQRGPGWRMLDPRRRRVYVLGVRTEWLALLPTCLLAGHWPLWLQGIGCGKCMPWPCCGSTGYDHAGDCLGDV